MCGLDVPSHLREIFFTRQLTLEWLFLSLQVVGGHFGMSALLLTFLLARGEKVQRSAVVISFCFSWMLSSICYSLLLYAYRTDPDCLFLSHESDRFCLIQAVLIYAAQTMTSLSTLCLITHLWFSINQPWFVVSRLYTQKIQFLLCILPYFGFILAFAPIWGIASQPLTIPDPRGKTPPIVLPDWALPTPLYCMVIDSSKPSGDMFSARFHITFVIGLFSVVIAILGFVLEGHILFRIAPFRKICHPVPVDFTRSFIRVLLFSLFRFIPLVIFVIGWHQPAQFTLIGFDIGKVNLATTSDLLQASLPLFAFLVLASRSDILAAWGLQRRKESSTSQKVMSDSESQVRFITLT